MKYVFSKLLMIPGGYDKQAHRSELTYPGLSCAEFTFSDFFILPGGLGLHPGGFS